MLSLGLRYSVGRFAVIGVPPLCGITCPEVYGLVREGYTFVVRSVGVVPLRF